MDAMQTPDPPPAGPRLRLSYLQGGFVFFKPGERLNPRILNDFELVRIHDGNATYRCNGKDHSVPPGGIILARPGSRETYTWDPRRDTRHSYVHFEIETVPEDWPQLHRWPSCRRTPDPLSKPLFDRLLSEVTAHRMHAGEKPSSRVERLVEQIIDLHLFPMGKPPTSQSLHRPEPVQRVLQWMRQLLDDTPDRSITLEEAARAGAVTPKHLCRLFTRHLKAPPMKVYRLLRLQLALLLLGRSNLTVKGIAARCGFESPFHFSRRFRETYGASPTEIRRRLLEGEQPPACLLPVDLTPRVRW